jgi:hypothetical protein
MTSRESLPAVTAAGVVAILFGLFGALGCGLGGLSILLLPQLPAAQGAPPMPPEARAMTAVFMFFMLAVTVFGIFVGVGVIRRRSWARIMILIWGGLMTGFCLLAVGFSLVIFSIMPTLDLPNANPAGTGQAMQFVRIFLVIFYGIPAGVGIWWLVLFTRKKVGAAFRSASPDAPPLAVDASGFPQMPVPAIAPLQTRPTCPLPLSIVAAFTLFGAVSVVLVFAFYPIPSDMPLFFFGHPFVGTAPKLATLIFGIVSGVTGIGIFKLKPWALYAQIAIQSIGLLNCFLTVLSPAYAPAMRVAMEKMYSRYPILASNNPFLSDAYFRSVMIFATLFMAVVLTVLLWQRARFLEAAATARA